MKSCKPEGGTHRHRDRRAPSRSPRTARRRRSTAERSSSASPGVLPIEKSRRHDGVHRDHERRREPAHEEVGRLEAVPVPRLAAPAEGEEAVGDLLAARRSARSRSVARSGMRPMYQNRIDTIDVGADREDVPHQRAAPLRPEVHHVGIGDEPVEEPRPAEVQDRHETGHRDGEDRHGLGEAVDRRAPVLAQQQQERGDEGAGVADADPPDEVGDGEGPGNRNVDAPDADAAREERS